MMAETRKMSDADRAGFVARSPEGHAARSMHIKGQEEVWIGIQVQTIINKRCLNIFKCLTLKNELCVFNLHYYILLTTLLHYQYFA